MKNYSFFEVGRFEHLTQYVFEGAAIPFAIPGKVFLKEKLALTGMEISFNTLPAGQAVPFIHRHRQHEEAYLFLSGQGEFQVDGEIFPIQQGTVVRVAPMGERVFRNTGDTDLIWIVVQAMNGSMNTETIEDGEAVKKPIRWS